MTTRECDHRPDRDESKNMRSFAPLFATVREKEGPLTHFFPFPLSPFWTKVAEFQLIIQQQFTYLTNLSLLFG